MYIYIAGRTCLRLRGRYTLPNPQPSTLNPQSSFDKRVRYWNVA